MYRSLALYVATLALPLIIGACSDQSGPVAGDINSINSVESPNRLITRQSGDENLALTAEVSTSYVSPWETLAAVNDGAIPESSGDTSQGAYGNWPGANTLQWVEYQWQEIQRLDSLDIYWFSDSGGVLPPTLAYTEYWQDNRWINAGNIGTSVSRFNSLDLGGVNSHRVRVLMLNNQQSTGILEWRIYGESTGVPARDAERKGSNIALTAKVSTSYVSPWETLSAVNDGAVPESSDDSSQGAYGNWPGANTLQWVEYQWQEIQRLDSLDIYWFSDNGGVLPPTVAYTEYWQDGGWINAGNIGTSVSQFNRLNLGGIDSHRVRVLMRNNQQSTGILEWQVYGESTGVAAPGPDRNTGQVPYRAVTNEYVHMDITADNSRYRDSDRFRAYYAGDGKNGGQGNVAEVPVALVDVGLQHLEAAYECLVDRRGFRSAALPLLNDQAERLKLNVYSTTTLNAGGAMGSNGDAGLSFFELRDAAIQNPGTVVHEYGHCLNYAANNWNGQNSTGAWWESVANFFTDSYFTDPECEQVRVNRGMARDMNTIIDLETTIGMSYLPIVSTRNYYQAWPFLTYISQNPDNYPGLGRLVLKAMFDNHRRNDETPLHVLERITSVPVQTIVARYWARMAYLDIDHPKAQARYLSTLNDAGFRARAFANLDALGGDRYRVKAAKQPQYAGANIVPLTPMANRVTVTLSNLGNGLAGSNFRATLSIRDSGTGQIRYVDLVQGSGAADISATEEVILVVANTPNELIQFNAFESTDTTPDKIGLNYEILLDGAVPAY